jgi:hypothetical protein
VVAGLKRELPRERTDEKHFGVDRLTGGVVKPDDK